MDSPIYLNHSIVTRPSSNLLDSLSKVHLERWGNPFSHHQNGQPLRLESEEYLQEIREILGLNERDIFMTTSGREENYFRLLFSHYTHFVRETGRTHIHTPTTEELLGFDFWKSMEKLGMIAKTIPVNTHGQWTKSLLEEFLKPRSGLLSLSWANPLTGVIQPIHEIAKICQEKEIKLHVDIGSVIGKIPFFLQEHGIDYATFAGELLQLSQGIGGIVMKHQVEVHFSNASSFSGIASCFLGLREAADQLVHLCMETARLRNQLELGICEAIPEAKILFQTAERLPHVSVIVFPGVCSESLLFYLSRQGVYAAIDGPSLSLASTLQACGIDPEDSYSAMSFSLSYETTEEEIQRAMEIIVTSAKKLQTYSVKK